MVSDTMKPEHKDPVEDLAIGVQGGFLVVRRRVHGVRTIVMVHGLGESGLSFKEGWTGPFLTHYDVIVPDLMGYGRSSGASDNDYGLDKQVQRLWQMVDHFGLERFFLVGHSMGGDIGTFMARHDPDSRILGFVNIEGNLTPHDIFISNQAEEANNQGSFQSWFYEDFMEKRVLVEWGFRWASCRRYYASLCFARPDAFRDNAVELVARNQSLPGTKACSTGLDFAALHIPKIFCWGTESLSKRTREFLREASIPNQEFPGAFHWPMIDQAEHFYMLLERFIEETNGG